MTGIHTRGVVEVAAGQDADSMDLRLRPPRAADEAPVSAAQRECGPEGVTFVYGWTPGQDWSRFLEWCERSRTGTDLPEGLVPDTRLLAEVDGELVGSITVIERSGGVLQDTLTEPSGTLRRRYWIA